MKTEKNDGAFAMVCSNTGAVQYGLSKREYFAAMAMQGFCSKVSISAPSDDYEYMVSRVVEIADKLIEELNKEK